MIRPLNQKPPNHTIVTPYTNLADTINKIQKILADKSVFFDEVLRKYYAEYYLSFAWFTMLYVCIYEQREIYISIYICMYVHSTTWYREHIFQQHISILFQLLTPLSTLLLTLASFQRSFISGGIQPRCWTLVNREQTSAHCIRWFTGASPLVVKQCSSPGLDGKW